MVVVGASMDGKLSIVITTETALPGNCLVFIGRLLGFNTMQWVTLDGEEFNVHTD